MIDLRAHDSGWIIDGLPSEVVAVRFQWQVELQFGDPQRWCFLQFEAPFTVDAPDGTSVLVDPAGDPSNLACVLPVLRRNVVALTVDPGETLTVSFDDGRVIRCRPLEDFEAWTLSAGAAGFFLASTPGGSALGRPWANADS